MLAGKGKHLALSKFANVVQANRATSIAVKQTVGKV